MPSPPSDLLFALERLADPLGRHPLIRRSMHGLVDHPGPDLPVEEEARAFFLAMESSGRAFLEAIPALSRENRERLGAAFELARLYLRYKDRERRASLTRPTDLRAEVWSRVPEALREAPQEWLGFVPHYRNGALGALCVVEKGCRTHVNVDPIELFARVLALRPEGFYLLHNHPSGDLVPSEADRNLTWRIRDAAAQLGLGLFGHGIVSPLGERWIVV